MTTSDILVNVGVVVIHIIIPTVLRTAFKTRLESLNVRNQNELIQQQRETLARIEALSTFVIICFCCTYGISFILADFHYLRGIGGPNTHTIIQHVSFCLLTCNATSTFFIFLMGDKRFRCEILKLFKRFTVCCLKSNC